MALTMVCKAVTPATGRFNVLQVNWLKPPEITGSPLKRAAFDGSIQCTTAKAVTYLPAGRQVTQQNIRQVRGKYKARNPPENQVSRLQRDRKDCQDACMPVEFRQVGRKGPLLPLYVNQTLTRNGLYEHD